MFGRNKNPNKPMVHIKIDFEKSISRLFIFRFLWVPAIIIPFAICGVWFSILTFAHFWYMLILGKRSEDIWAHQIHVIHYLAGWQAYLRFYVNRHPAVWPW